MVNAFKLNILFLFFLSFPSFSIVFTKDHTRVLFTEIDGWVRGEINGISFNKLGEDKVFTILSLSVEEFAGLSKSHITNTKNFKVYYPGGEWLGVNISYSGSPKFSIGDNYIFLLNKQRGGFFVNGFSAGAIKVDKANDQIIQDLRNFSDRKFKEVEYATNDVSQPQKLNLDKKRQPAANKMMKDDSPSIEKDISIVMIVFIILLVVFLFLFVGRSENSKF